MLLEWQLLSSLGPVYGINSACAIATTINQWRHNRIPKLLLSLDKWFNLDLVIPDDANQKLIEKLKDLSPESKGDLVSELTKSHDALHVRRQRGI